MLIRLLVGSGLAALGSAAGPGGAYAGWKLGGFLATGNPIYLIPGGGTVTDAVTMVTDASDLADAGIDLGDGPDPGERKNW